MDIKDVKKPQKTIFNFGVYLTGGLQCPWNDGDSFRNILCKLAMQYKPLVEINTEQSLLTHHLRRQPIKILLIRRHHDMLNLAGNFSIFKNL